MANITVNSSHFTGILSALTIDADKNWNGKNITNFGTNGYDVHAQLVLNSKSSFITYTCLASVAVRDVVYLAGDSDTFVRANTDNTQVMPSIGVVTEKPTSTTATVQTFGPCALSFAGLTDDDKKVFLHTDGTLTTTMPTTGYVQIIGVNHYSGKLFIKPEFDRVKSNPF